MSVHCSVESIITAGLASRYACSRVLLNFFILGQQFFSVSGYFGKITNSSWFLSFHLIDLSSFRLLSMFNSFFLGMIFIGQKGIMAEWQNGILLGNAFISN